MTSVSVPQLGPKDTGVIDHNLFSALAAAFPQDTSQCAVETDAGLFYSWQDLLDASAMVANMLESLELAPGARIAVQVEKSVEALILYLASLRAGLVYLPLNSAYQSAEMAYFLGDAVPAVLVCSGHHFGELSKLAFAAGTTHVFTLNQDRTGTLLSRAAQFSRAHAVAQAHSDDLAAIIYTSGTTGRSKGAMLSHGNLLSNAEVLKAYWGWRRAEQGGDVLIHALPIFHVHGLFVAIHGALLNGSKMIWLAKFDTRTVLRHLPRATVFMGVPTLYVRLLAETGLNRAVAQGMRLFISGSAPLLLDTFAQWQQRTGHTILERYGMSETAMLTSNPYLVTDGVRKGGTVGRPLPGVQLRIFDDGDKLLPAGEVGGIQVKGPNVFQGYWNMPDKTSEEFTTDGFFKTGDVGYIDADGYVTIVGRSKDLIISGGYNVYPAEIESYINAIPGVAESAVVGVPDDDFGEVGVAAVIAKPGVELQTTAILSQLKAILANFKVPKKCVVLSELPRNTMGKVQKNVLRQQFQE
ncbi:MAG: malonyl-CoA synthase [Rhodoferax sp.]|nr:malonyl-CoA synthase [Rhodoferax sp.]MCF8210261.1 malonyl-CoA synthase [Rhodoferax sp.]